MRVELAAVQRIELEASRRERIERQTYDRLAGVTDCPLRWVKGFWKTLIAPTFDGSRLPGWTFKG